jgi:hypothetical protein
MDNVIAFIVNDNLIASIAEYNVIDMSVAESGIVAAGGTENKKRREDKKRDKTRRALPTQKLPAGVAHFFFASTLRARDTSFFALLIVSDLFNCLHLPRLALVFSTPLLN